MTNKLICGDNLSITANMPSNSVDLIYIDPPFFSNRNYEIVWGDEAEIRSFEDRWDGGINVYIDWLKHRIFELYRILKPSGTFYLHCDWHASHYLKVMCDDIFSYNNFRNEIIWCYRGAGYPKNDFGKRHDNILRYSKTDVYTFNVDEVREEYAEATKERFKHYIGNIRDGKDFGEQKLHPLGKRPDDWWQIQPIAPSARARTGYPTQKPEELLDRIIKSSSNEGDLVLDSFCGCGTTLASANNFKRKWIGIDISPSAITLIKSRLSRIGVKEEDYLVIGMPKSIEELKKFTHFDFQFWVINELHGMPSPKKTGDMGIDGFSYMKHYPMQVKQQEKVGRVEIDKLETAISRYNENNEHKIMKGFIIAFSFGKGAKEEVIKSQKRGFKIKLVTIQEILDKNFTVDDMIAF